MPVAAWLLGDPGRIRYTGHFRGQQEGLGAGGASAGRVGWSEGPILAFEPARLVEEALRVVKGPLAEVVLAASWSMLAGLDKSALGPKAGTDLSLLLVAWDARGVQVTGCGLSGAWALVDGRAVPIALLPEHAVPGIPATPPPAIPLELGPHAIVGAAMPHPADLPPFDLIAQRCGVHA